MSLTTSLGFDFPNGTRQPLWWRWILASVVAVGGSLLACALLVKFGESAFPSTIGYEHYGFDSYGKLTVLGVGAACVAWPVVTWFSSKARLPFLWLAIAVSIVALAPDVWILAHGQSAQAVFVLVLMHLALAVITYPALVFIAPQRTARAHA